MERNDERDFFDLAILEDPFPFFDDVRPVAPVLPVRQSRQDRDLFLVTSYPLIEQVLKNPESFSSKFYEVFLGGAGPNPEAAAIYARGWPEIDVMLTSDEPEHARYRSLASTAFTPKRIKAMEPKIVDAIDLLIDRFIERGKCNFVEEFAVPLPIYMISDILGLDRSMYRQFFSWSNAYMVRNSQIGSVEDEVEAAKLVVECQRFLFEEIQKRRSHPADDLISDLVHAHIDGAAPLDDVELLSMLQIILVAGNETTRNAMLAIVARLLGPNRDQLPILLADLSLARNAVEEALRLEPPASTTWRVARHDLELGGVRIPEGAILMCRFDAANRDAAIFERPNAFDIRRPNAVKHLSFGVGIHFCIGHVLARRELNLALPRLLERLPGLRMIPEESDLRVHPTVHVRSMRALSIAFEPGRPLRPGATL